MFHFHSKCHKSYSVMTRHYPWVIVNYIQSFESCCSVPVGQVPSPDIVVVPGGIGTRQLIHDQPIIEWIRKVRHACSWILIIGIMIRQVLYRILLVGQESDPHEMTDFPHIFHVVYVILCTWEEYVSNRRSLDPQLKGEFAHSSQSTPSQSSLVLQSFRQLMVDLGSCVGARDKSVHNLSLHRIAVTWGRRPSQGAWSNYPLECIRHIVKFRCTPRQHPRCSPGTNGHCNNIMHCNSCTEIIHAACHISVFVENYPWLLCRSETKSLNWFKVSSVSELNKFPEAHASFWQ